MRIILKNSILSFHNLSVWRSPTYTITVPNVFIDTLELDSDRLYKIVVESGDMSWLGGYSDVKRQYIFSNVNAPLVENTVFKVPDDCGMLKFKTSTTMTSPLSFYIETTDKYGMVYRKSFGDGGNDIIKPAEGAYEAMFPSLEKDKTYEITLKPLYNGKLAIYKNGIAVFNNQEVVENEEYTFDYTPTEENPSLSNLFFRTWEIGLIVGICVNEKK